MAGTLTVQNIQGPTSGDNANKIIVPSGHVLNAAGHVIQVKQGTSTTETTATGQTIVDTTLSVSITPSSSSSKIYVVASFNGGSNTAGAGAAFYIYRDSTKLMAQGGTYSGTATSNYGGMCLSYLDSPSSTSSISYNVKLNVQSAGNTGVFNTAYTNITGTVATITAMEIAG